MPVMRLDKLISSSGLASRNEARNLIRAGRVQVNGRPASADTHVITETDNVTLDGNPVVFAEHITYMMNKPAGVLSATEDAREKTVVDLLDPIARRRGVAPAGRLDKDTEGLLILTDDGELAHKIISPSHGIVKIYEAVVESPPEPDAEYRIANGIMLGDGTKCLPGRLERLEETKVRLYISEGKYHQVKRMLANTGAPVTKLTRIAIGGLMLDNRLEPGEYRPISENEIKKIFNEQLSDL